MDFWKVINKIIELDTIGSNDIWFGDEPSVKELDKKYFPEGGILWKIADHYGLINQEDRQRDEHKTV